MSHNDRSAGSVRGYVHGKLDSNGKKWSGVRETDNEDYDMEIFLLTKPFDAVKSKRVRCLEWYDISFRTCARLTCAVGHVVLWSRGCCVLRRSRTSDRYTRPTTAKGIRALVRGLAISTKVGNETPKRHGVAQTRYPPKAMASRRNDKACGDHPKYKKTVILCMYLSS
jgi:hypothetical protein